MQIADLALQRNKYKHLTDDEWRWFLQQEEGRQRTADKLPTFAAISDWWYPVRLSCEQCSSELTARYKAQLVNPQSSNRQCLDLTGGYGVDTFFLSQHFAHTDYVEQNPELCRIAGHNFNLQGNTNGSIAVHNSAAEDFLKIAGQYHLIFLDPARRDCHGGKVFRLQDCTPDVTVLLPTLRNHLAPDGRLLLKLSPMLDITQAIKELSSIPNYQSPLTWDIHIVAVKNEVKEVLLLSGGTGQITAVDLSQNVPPFVFTREEEQSAQAEMFNCPKQIDNCQYLYEPSAAILKAGAYKLVAQRFGLQKLDPNTHLYVSDKLISSFPGRVWKIAQPITSHQIPLTNANILVRNYPLTPDQLKKKLHLRDGGTAFIIGCRISDKPTLLLAERLK
ncbi:MAG: SAM-dependent methyltransferase [Paludibacteraceae bacterium]|nr:SAM-dependent methyltransferase [Paludibacteraceae bacterium]